jgi:Zn-dependent protease with chaperone function
MRLCREAFEPYSNQATMNPADPNTAPPVDPETGGFGHSKRRFATELAIMVGGLVALAGGAIWAAGALSTVLLPFISTDVDVSLGRQGWDSPELALQRCGNSAPLNYVQQVSAPLIAALGQTPYQFQFQVVSNEEVNAFALPGGFVTVNIGLLQQAQNGDEVAAVIAHELQHVLLRHGTRRMLRQMGGFSVISLLFGGSGAEYPAYWIGQLTSLSYDRNEESQADQGGLLLMQKAKVNPLGMATFFERLQKEGGPNVPALLSDHPDPGDRARLSAEAALSARDWQKLPAPQGLSCN